MARAHRAQPRLLAAPTTAANPAAAYFVTPTRAWEFGAGGLLARAARRPRASVRRAAVAGPGSPRSSSPRSPFSVATPFPGSAALVPVLGAARGDPRGRRRALGADAAARAACSSLGDISYSVYLWHWPLLVLAPFVVARELNTDTRIGILMLTLVLAWLSKRLIEDPRAQPRRSCSAAAVLDLRRRRRGDASSWSLADAARVVARATARSATPSAPRSAVARLAAALLRRRRARSRAAVPEPEAAARRSCRRRSQAREPPNAPCRRVERDASRCRSARSASPQARATATIALHRRQPRVALARRARRVARHSGWRGLSITRTRAARSRRRRATSRSRTRSSCKQWRRQVFALVRRAIPEVSTVFVAAAHRRQRGRSPAASRRGRGRAATGAPGTALPASVEHIVVIRDTPKFDARAPTICIERAIGGTRPAGRACAVRRAELARPRRAAVAAAPAALAARVTRVDLTRFFCDPAAATR